MHTKREGLGKVIRDSAVTAITVAGLFSAVSQATAQPAPDQLAAADAGSLPTVAANEVPSSRIWWLWSLGLPVPFNQWPDLTCYDLSDGSFLLDDRGATPTGLFAAAAAEQDASSPAMDVRSYFPEKADAPCDCGFIWLSVAATASNYVSVSVHNTLPGRSYALYSTTNLAIPYTNWPVETNLTGGAGDITDALLAMGTRPNLFLRAAATFDYSAARDYTNIQTISGIGWTNTESNPPDTMGSIGGGGTGHFVELLNDNGNAAFPETLVVYDRTGAITASSTSRAFFDQVSIADSRVLFDSHARRWVATTLGITQTNVIIKVSRSEDPTDLSTNGWYRKVIAVGAEADFDTLGLDDNGVYLTVVNGPWTITNSQHTVVAIKKPEIYSGTLISTNFALTNDLGYGTIQPALNFDPLATNGYTWMLAKGPPQGGQGGPLMYRRLHWEGTTGVVDTTWTFITNAATPYQDYYDFERKIEIQAVLAPQNTAQGGASIELYTPAGHLAITCVRGGYLWTCHTVGLQGTNGTYGSDITGENVDRSGIQWFKLGADPASGALSYVTHGRIYDNIHTTNAWWYYFGSIMANCAGDIVSGCSGSTATDNLSGFYWYRDASGATPGSPRLLQAGIVPLSTPRIGDYSATSIDPFDDWKFWTVQEYADPAGAFYGDTPWKTIVSEIRPGP